MKTKAALAVSLAVAFAAGAGAGSLLTTALRPPAAAAPTTPASPASESAAPPKRVRADRPVDTPPPPAAPATTATSPPTRLPDAKPADKIPDAVARAAADLGVSEGALQAAMAAFAAVSARDEAKAKAALAALHGFGDDGFRAVVSLLRGGVASTDSERLVEASWSPGGERLLMDLADTHPVGEAQYAPHLAVWCLGATDTPAVREWLLARAASETDAGLYMNVTHALGHLKEARGIALCQDKLAKRADVDWNLAWNEVIRSYILGDVGRMARGDPDAGRRALVTYLRDEGADRVDWAIRMLRDIDPAAARAEAAALLSGPRAKTLTSDAVAALRDAAR